MGEESNKLNGSPNSKKNVINWSQYGLSETTPYKADSSIAPVNGDFLYTTESREEVKDLFEDEQEVSKENVDPI